MTDRMTNERLTTRLDNLNRRMAAHGSIIRYALNGRNGYTALDRIRDADGACLDLVIIGTKREVGDYLHAAMTILDDAARKS